MPLFHLFAVALVVGMIALGFYVLRSVYRFVKKPATRR